MDTDEHGPAEAAPPLPTRPTSPRGRHRAPDPDNLDADPPVNENQLAAILAHLQSQGGH
jgi:hypothetical protein